MSALYKGRYRIESTRAPWWNYSRNAAYFVTICAKNRQHFFGDVNHGKMILSPVGVIADILWYEIKNHAVNVDLGQFVVMPNHIHGIIILNNPAENNPTTDGMDGHFVETRHALSLQNDHPYPAKSRFQNQGKNTLSSIIGSYKSAVSKHAHRLGFEFAWQPRFHDHIIRHPDSYNRISEYIHHNPHNWERDAFNK